MFFSINKNKFHDDKNNKLTRHITVNNVGITRTIFYIVSRFNLVPQKLNSLLNNSMWGGPVEDKWLYNLSVTTRTLVKPRQFYV